jgi:uncharacterized membrane protein YdjX (TVP38/TMEM64 family)
VDSLQKLTKPLILRISIVAGLLLILIYFLTFGREPLNNFLAQVREVGPVAFFLVFAIGISAGIPATPFLFMAGATFDVLTNIIGLSACFAFSLAISFFYANRLFKRQLGDFMQQKAPVISGILQANPIAATILVRLTPGFPYVLQYCFLVTVSRSFAAFFLASLPPVLAMATLYTLMGKNLMGGNYRLLILVGFILAAVILVMRFITQRRTAKTK